MAKMEDPLLREFFIEGVVAAKAHAGENARRYLERLLRLDTSIEDCMKAWYWMSQISANPAEKGYFLYVTVQIQPYVFSHL
jgi:hypothetical protein